MSGTLYIVATPIGNLKDITLRAIEILKNVDLIAAEDTRHTKKLLSYYEISKRTTSYFEHNKNKKGKYIIDLLKQGNDVALVSDSGTPGISDPGFYITNLAIKNNIPIKIIPGPCAAVCALVLSGKPADKFVFEGFLSNKRSGRLRRLRELKDEKRTIILYESPYRIVKMLEDIYEVMGDVEVACVREMTKIFEESRREKITKQIEHFSQHKPKGEFVVVI